MRPIRLEYYLRFYNQVQLHRALDGHTPDRVYLNHLSTRDIAV